MPRNVADLVKPPRPTQAEFQTWTIECIAKFLVEARKTRYYTVFLIAIMTGMRREEVCALR